MAYFFGLFLGLQLLFALCCIQRVFFLKYHRKSCFGALACRPAPLPGAAELWEHGWSVVLCVTAPSDANASSAGKGSFSSLLLRTKGANSERV